MKLIKRLGVIVVMSLCLFNPGGALAQASQTPVPKPAVVENYPEIEELLPLVEGKAKFAEDELWYKRCEISRFELEQAMQNNADPVFVRELLAEVQQDFKYFDDYRIKLRDLHSELNRRLQDRLMHFPDHRTPKKFGALYRRAYQAGLQIASLMERPKPESTISEAQTYKPHILR